MLFCMLYYISYRVDTEAAEFWSSKFIFETIKVSLDMKFNQMREQHQLYGLLRP